MPHEFDTTLFDFQQFLINDMKMTLNRLAKHHAKRLKFTLDLPVVFVMLEQWDLYLQLTSHLFFLPHFYSICYSFCLRL